MARSEPRVNAPEFPAGLEWLNTEQPLTLRALRGKIVLLDFWTSGCINCIHNLPQLHHLQEQFPEELVVIGVHSAKFPSEQLTATIRAAVLRHGIDHPVANDTGLRMWDEYAVRAWPTVVLIDDRGKVVRTQSGEFLAEEITPVVRSLVALAEHRGTLNRQPLDLRSEQSNEPTRPLSYPSKLLLAPNGRLFVADTGHHRIVELRLADNGLSASVERVFGSGVAALRDGTAQEAAFHSPRGMALLGDTLYVADTDNHAVRAIDLGSGAVRTVAGTGAKAHGPILETAASLSPLRSPWDLAATDTGDLWIAMAGSHQIWKLRDEKQLELWAGAGFEALLDGPRLQAGFNQPSGLARGTGQLFVADAEASAIRAVGLDEPGEVTTLVGQGLFAFGDSDGVGEAAQLQHPVGLALYRGMIFIADSYNHKIKQLDLATGAVTTLIGTGTSGHTDGPFASAMLFEPEGLTITEWGAKLLCYIADTNNHLIRVGDMSGDLSTLRIQGLDQLGPAQPSVTAAIRLPAVTVGAGRVTLHIDIALPHGTKRNPDAPLTIREVDQHKLHSFSADASPVLTIDATGDQELLLDVTVYSCETSNEGLCRIHDLRLLLPLQVVPDGSMNVRVLYSLPA